MGVPFRGVSNPWNARQNDFDASLVLQLARLIVKAAQTKVANGTTIKLGDNDYITPNEVNQLSEKQFIDKYVPGLKALQATYPFIRETESSNTLRTAEYIDPGERNDLLLDLNDGFDSENGEGDNDPNKFADRVEQVTVIYGTGSAANDTVVGKIGPDFEIVAVDPNGNVIQQPIKTILPLDEFFSVPPEEGQLWYEDRRGEVDTQGDKTVPALSAIGTFGSNNRPNIRPPEDFSSVTHSQQPFDRDVQKFILETLGINLKEEFISTNLNNNSLDLFSAINNGYNFAGAIILDPVEGFLVDGQARRLGYSEATGAITEIPGSFWLGEEDGIGFFPEPVEGSFQLELTGLDEDYFVSIALETDNSPAGIELEGFLNAGEQIIVDVPLIPSVNSYQAFAEYGVIDNLTDDFQTIDLTNNYTNPVVFAQPLSFNGPEPAAVRLDNITGNSFEIQAQEANYLDGSHSAEQVSYFVLEAGTWQLPSGETIQVGTTNSDQLVSNEWESVTFDQQFETIPAVFSQVQTKNDSDFVRTRSQNLTAECFEFGMEEEEANKNSGHANETLGWFAIESGNGTWNGNNYQIGTTGDTVTHNWSSLDLDPNFSQAP